MALKTSTQSSESGSYIPLRVCPPWNCHASHLPISLKVCSGNYDVNVGCKIHPQLKFKVTVVFSIMALQALPVTLPA